MAFDVERALRDGYTQEQIDAYIQQNNITPEPIEVTPEPIEEVTEEVTEEVITAPTPQPSPEPTQKTFDVEGALRDGYTQEQIDNHLKLKERKKTFDIEEALRDGYTQEQIDNYLQGNTPQQTQQQKDLENESDGLRGFDQYGNQLGGLYGAGKILLGKLFDSDDMIVSGLGYMNRSDEAVQARGVKDTDTFVNAWDKGVYEVITDWLPYNLGQAVGIGLETVAVALVGGIAGSAIGPTGTVGGLLGGLVAKKIVKKTIIDEARKIAKEEGKDAAKEFVAKEVTKALADPKKNAILRKEVNKAVGRNVALTGMAAKFGAGETVGRAVDEAIKDTENPAEQLAIIKELSTGRLASLSAAHAAADFIGARILLKPLQALAKPTQKFLLRFAKKFMMAAPGEAITEVIQSFIERYAAELPLADKEAIIEYVNASAAGFVMPAPTSFLGSIRDYQPSKIVGDKKDNLDPELEPEVDDNKDPRQEAINNILNDEKNIIKTEEEVEAAKRIKNTKITTIDEEMLKDLGINPKTNAGKELLGKDLTDLDNMEMIDKILSDENLQVKRNQKAVDNFKRKIKRDRKKILKAQEEAQDEKQPTPKGQGTGASDKVPNKSESVITTGINTSDTTTVDTDKSGVGGTTDTTGTVDDTLKTETPKIEIEKKNPLVKGKKGNKAKVARINNGKVEILEGVLEEGSSGLELIGKGRGNTKIITPLNEQQILNPNKKDLEKLEVKANQAIPASTPEVKPKTKPKPKKKLLGDTLNEATEEELNAEGYESFTELDKDGNEKKRYRNIKTKKPLFAKESTDTEKKLTEVRKQKQLAIERAENQRNQDGRVSPAYRKPIMQLQQMEDELLKQDSKEKKELADQRRKDKLPPEQQELFAKDETIADTGETKQSVMGSFVKEFGRNVNLGVKRGLLNIVDTVADLPNIIPNVDILPANVKAIYFDGKAYFIADRITKEDAPRMLLHEIGAHYGLEGMLGKANYDRIVKSLRSKKTSDTEIEAAFIYVRDSYPELAESSDDFIQEVIANIAEDAPNNTVYRRIVGYIKNFLSKLGMGWNVDNITAAQIQDMVQHSVRVSLAQPDVTPSTRTALASKDLETAGNVFYSPLEKAINKQKIESMSVQEWKDYLSKRAGKEGFVNQLDASGILDWMNMLQRRKDILDKNLPNAPIDLDGFDLDDRGRLSKDDILSWLGQYDVLVVDVIPQGAMSESEIENIREEETARLTEEIMGSSRYEDLYAEIEEQAGFIDESIPGVYRVFGSEHRQTDPGLNEEPYAIFIDESLIGSENFNLTPIDVIASETNEGVIIDKQPALAYLKLAKDKGFNIRIISNKEDNYYNQSLNAEDSARDYLYETHNPEQENIGDQLQDVVDEEVANRVDEIINEATYERDEGTYRDMQRTRDDGGVPEEYFEIVLSLDNKGGTQSNIYTSPHFEAIQNAILSIRADIRYDQDGNKVLFVEEVQSDWAESLRKNKTSSNRKTKYGDLAYVEDTQLWTKLAIKRIIRLAAENEVDKVAFLNPMQAVSVHSRTDLAAEEYYGKILPSVLRKTLNSLENTSRQKNEIIRFKPIYKTDDATLDLLREIYELHVGDGRSLRELDNIDYTPADGESFRKFQKTNELVSKLNKMYESLDSFRDIYDFANRVIKITQDYNTDTDLLRPETRKATLERLASEFSPMDATVKKRESLTKQIDKLDAQILDGTKVLDNGSTLRPNELVDKKQDLQAQRSSLPSVNYNRYNMLNLIVKQKKLTMPEMTNEQVGFTMTPKLQKVAQAGMPLFAKQGSKTRKQLKQEIEDAKTNKEKLNDKRKKAGQKTDDPADPFYNSNEWKKPMSKIRGFQNAVFGYDIGLYNKLRDEITRISKTKSVKEAQKFIEDTLARISIAQAVHAETLAGAFKEMGNIIFDPAIEKFEIIRDTYNLRSIENMVRKFANKNFKKGITLSKDDIADAEKFISQAITALQFKRIIENNKVLEAQGRLLVRQGKKAEAEKVMQGYVYVDQTEAQLDKMIERFDDYPEIKEIQQSWIGVKNNVLQFLLDTEVIDQEQFDEYTLVGGVTKDSLDKLREDVFVPLYREGQPNIPRSVRKGTSSGRGIFVPRKGSIEPVDNVFLNMDIFVQAGITKGIANKTALQKIRTALEVQAEEDLIVRPTEERTKGFEDNAVEVSEIGPDGKQRKQLYEYSNIMYAKATNGAAKAMELGQGFLEVLGRNTSTVLRDFVVLNPIFGLAQTFAQDMNSAIFASNLRYGAIMIPLRVLYEFPATILGISSAHKTLKRYGAAGGYAFKQNDNNIDADINAPGFYNALIRGLSRIPGTNIPTGLTQEGALKLGDTRLSIGGLLNRIAMASDNSVRQAVYKQALMENKSHHRALETAFEIINFRKTGDHGLITFGRQYIPFFGALLQALSVQGKILQGLAKPNSGVTASTLSEARINYLVAWSSVAGVSLMLRILLNDDEDEIIEQFSDQPVSEELKRYLREMRRNFNQLDNKIRDRRFIIGDDGFHITLRPDFNTYVAKVIPEQVYDSIIAENQDAAKFWTSIKRNAREIITLNLIPQVVRPMVDVYYNEDSRSGRPIIPERMKNLPPELQVLPSSTEAAKKIGAIIGTSPIIVDYYFRQYFGYAGGLATMLAESYYLEADTNPYRKNKPAKTTRDKIASFPGMTNFYSKDKDNRFMADFYELKNKVSQVTAIFRTLDNSPNPEDGIKAQDFLNEGNNQKLYDASIQINIIQETLSEIRKSRQNIYDQPANAVYNGRLMTDEFKRLLLKDLEQQEVDALHTIHDLRVSIYGTNPFYNIETGEFFPGFDMTDLFEKGG